MNVKIELMNKDHADAVTEISNLSFSDPWKKDSYIKEVQNPVALYLVALSDNEVVGFIGTWNVLDESHITNVAVHPDFRKLKIGSMLLDSLIKICEEKHKTVSFDLEVRRSNIPAQKLYSKFNFKETGIRKGYYADNKEDAILMCRFSV